MFNQLFRFFVYSNLFIAGCAVLMAQQTFLFLLQQEPDKPLLFFILSSTLCSYSFHWYLTSESVLPSPRIQWLRRNRSVHLTLFLAGLAGAVYFFYQLADYWLYLLAAVVVTFLYSAPKIPHPLFRALRKVAIGKTIFLAFVWMYVTTALPVIVAEQPWKSEYTLYALGRFFYIYAICILFDYRDRADDKAVGIRSLITWLSEKGITYLFIFSLGVFTAFSLMLLYYGYAFLPVALLLIPGIILTGIYQHARSHFSDMLYYFVLDGLMALSALLMLIAAI